MNFAAAISSAFHNFADFKGRARRSEYWWFILFNAIVSTPAMVLDAALGTRLVEVVVGLVVLLPGLAVAVRRLHDTDRRGWWILIAVVPLVGLIVLLIFQCTDSQLGPNRFGPSPKYASSGPGWGAHSAPA